MLVNRMFRKRDRQDLVLYVHADVRPYHTVTLLFVYDAIEGKLYRWTAHENDVYFTNMIEITQESDCKKELEVLFEMCIKKGKILKVGRRTYSNKISGHHLKR
jgi:hypothetical protein